MEINFIANEIVYEVTEYNSYLVGFADDKNEPKEYVIVERALEFDEQDIKLGMDSYYFEYSDQSNSGYGLCDKVILRQNEIVFSAKHKCMDDITSITVSYNENIIEDVNEIMYLQLIIPQYFISNKSGIWSLSLIVHSKG